MSKRRTIAIVLFLIAVFSMSITYTPVYATTRVDQLGNSLGIDTSYNGNGGEAYVRADGAKLGGGVGIGGISVSSPMPIAKVESLTVTVDYTLNGVGVSKTAAADIPYGGSAMAAVTVPLAPSFVGPVTPMSPAPQWPCSISDVTTTASASYSLNIPSLGFWTAPLVALDIPAGQITATQYLP